MTGLAALTYEELIEEIEVRAKELGGIGAHREPMAAAKARLYALITLNEIIAAAKAAVHELEKCDELYLAK